MDALKEEITGPVSGELFRDPVLATDGHTYERESIETWFQQKSTSPMTGLQISRNLVPNQLAKKMVLKYLDEHPEESDGHLEFSFDATIDRLKLADFSVLKRYHSIPLDRALDGLTYTVLPTSEYVDESIETYSLMQWMIEKSTDPVEVERMLNSAADLEAVDEHGYRLVHYLAGSRIHYELLGRFSETQLNQMTQRNGFENELTALGVAIDADHLPAVEMIAKSVATDTMIMSNYSLMISYPPVLYAVHLGRIELVKKMVGLGWGLDDYTTSGYGDSSHNFEHSLHLLAQHAPLPDLLELSKPFEQQMWMTPSLKNVTPLWFAFRQYSEAEIVTLLEELINRGVVGGTYTILDSQCDYNPYSGGIGNREDGDAIRDRLFDRFNGRFDFGQFDSSVMFAMLVRRDLSFYRRMMKIAAVQEMILTRRYFYLDRTILHHAIANHRTDLADALIDDGIDLGGVTSTKETTLSYSLQFGYARGVELAIERGVELTTANVAGMYPIHRLPAVPENLRLRLIELTPDPILAHSCIGTTPYEIAVTRGFDDAAVEIKRRLGETDEIKRVDKLHELTSREKSLADERRQFEAEKQKFRQRRGIFSCLGFLKKGK